MSAKDQFVSPVSRRPATIVSSAAYQLNRPDVILLAISSEIREQRAVMRLIDSTYAQTGRCA